jgi:peptidoglycan-N-acetylglucosamine deacetylase
METLVEAHPRLEVTEGRMFDLTLTFDNGPDPAVTPFVLDVLAEHGVSSTFFVIGSKLGERNARACAERAHGEGHWIGNHTWSHGVPLGVIRRAKLTP